MGKALDLLLNRKAESEEPGVSTPEPDFSSMSPAMRVLYTPRDVGPGGSYTVRERDIGAIGAFTSGVKREILAPLNILRGKVAETDPRIDEGAEKVGNLLGSFVGMGISFIPFALGTGAVLRGLGMASRIPQVVNGISTGQEIASPLYGFVRNTIAGATQFAGTAGEAAEVPGKLVEGAVFGGVIEGLFLLKAMRVRGGKVIDGHVSGDQIQMENAVIPHESQSPDLIKTELDAVFEPERRIDIEINRPQQDIELVVDEAKIDLGSLDKPVSITLPDEMSVERALVATTKDHQVTSRVTSRDPELLIKYARQELPEAQVLRRGDEVLIHNPSIPEERFTPKQEAQYKATGYVEGMEVHYTNQSGTRSYKVTGGVAAEGRVQLQDPINPSTVFAPKISQVTRLVNPRFWMEAAQRKATYRQLVEIASNRVGFAVAAGDDVVRKGFIDTAKFQTVDSIEEFVKTNALAISRMGGETLEENVKLFAKLNDITGLALKEGGEDISKYEIFDQAVVSMKENVAPMGVDIDQALVILDETGQPMLQFLTPSWKNSLIENMRIQGIKEKDFQTYLDIHETEIMRDLLKVTDENIQSTFAFAKGTFTEGCL